MHLSPSRLVALCVAVVTFLAPATEPVATAAPKRPDPDCFACLVVADDGTVLFQRRADIVLPNASTTKMVTALVVMSSGVTLDEEVRVSAGAAATPPVRIALMEGERFTVRELLTALLLGSSNQAAVALAEHVAGTEGSFVEEMDDLTDSLGADSTGFANAHGLDAPGHGATARDLATIASALLEEEALAEIVRFEDALLTSQQRSLEVENTNELLGEYEGLVGVKTGFTADAGRVLVAAAERDGRRLIAVAMRSSDAFAAARSLLDYGFEMLSRGILLAKMTPMTDVVFDPSGSISAVVARNVRGSELPDRTEARFEAEPDLALPLEPGDRVGTAVVVDRSGATLGRSPVIVLVGAERGEEEPWPASALAGLLSGVASLLPGEGR